MSIQDIKARLGAASEVFDSIKDAPEVPVADADFFQFARTDMFELLARIAKLEGRLMSANDANTAWSLVSDTKDARIAKLEGALAKGELLQEFYIEGLEKSDAEIEGLKELLRKAQIHFCSNVCPCVWKTEDGQVHHDACIQMSQALKGGGRMSKQVIIEFSGGGEMSKRVSESIYSDGSLVVPLADVQHIEKRRTAGSDKDFLMIIMKSTRYNTKIDDWDNPVYVPAVKAQAFLSAWCFYRHELEYDTLADVAGAAVVAAECNALQTENENQAARIAELEADIKLLEAGVVTVDGEREVLYGRIDELEQAMKGGE